MRNAIGLLLAVGLASSPAFAQTPPQTAAQGGSSSATGASSIGSATPTVAPGKGGDAGEAAPNPALADNGDVRASKVVGASVYNDKNEKLGSVDDILLDKTHRATEVVLSVGGVLGVGAKLVAVPYDKLTFPANVDNNNARVMMPGATADALNGMPTFRYAAK